ncbi:MAG: nitroreductase family protein [Desulfovibrionaceae bacterium]
MDVLEAIHTRRSIRKYTDRPVSEDVVRELLAAAMAAPSAGNAQPWHFVVITDQKLREQLATVHPYVGMIRQSPVAILVCGDPSLEKYPGYWVQDCAAAVQNLLLAAHGLGLGAVWTGVCPDAPRMEKIAAILGLPQGVMPHALVPIGYPAQPAERKDRFRADRVHRNGW